MNDLIISEFQIRQIEAEGAAAYPNECCGIIYGRDSADGRVVERLEPVANDFEAGEQYHRFSISPKLLMAAEKSAADQKQLVIGFYHSHPDHPARPSEFDRTHAWPFYSYVIIAIEQKTPALLTSWLLDEASEQFGEQMIRRTK